MGEQEPRVMAVSRVVDVPYGRPIYYEGNDDKRIYAAFVARRHTRDKVRLFIVGDDEGFMESKAMPWREYNKTWRCWSSMPSDEKRKSAKWNVAVTA